VTSCKEIVQLRVCNSNAAATCVDWGTAETEEAVAVVVYGTVEYDECNASEGPGEASA
jgi:hypothetical protein